MPPMKLLSMRADRRYRLPWVGRIDRVTRTENNEYVARLWGPLSTQSVVLRRIKLKTVGETPSSQPTSDELARCIAGDIRALCELRHPSVQACLGFCSDKNLSGTYIVLDHIQGVPVLSFLAQSASSDRCRLVSELANGLNFLHKHAIVHGSVCSDNITVARDERAVLTGLGCKPRSPDPLDPQKPDWMHMHDEFDDEPEPQTSLTELQQADDPRFDYRWYPENRDVVVDGVADTALADAARSSLHSDNAAGDVFAFGFAVIEIFTGIRTSSTPSALRLLRMVTKAAWPPHPGRIPELRGLDQTLWNLCLRAWRFPGLQPIDMGLFAAAMDEPRSDIVICPVKWRLLELQAWVDTHVRTFTGVRKFERVEPARDIDDNIITIHITVKNAGRKVKAKLISHEFLRRVGTKKNLDFYGEVMVWWQLRHPNVLPLFGLCFYRIAPAFIVHWPDGGSCIDFLSQHPDAPRLAIAEQVAAGLNYMHTRTPPVVHGDVRAHNVVFTSEGIAQLANFDFGSLQDPAEGFDTSLTLTDRAVRNAAPDFINSRTAERTTWGDVYSFALFMHEMYSGNAVFHEIVNYQELLRTVRAGKRPDRPDHCAQLGDDIWALMNLCWRRRPMSRPTMAQVHTRIVELISQQCSFSA